MHARTSVMQNDFLDQRGFCFIVTCNHTTLSCLHPITVTTAITTTIIVVITIVVVVVMPVTSINCARV